MKKIFPAVFLLMFFHAVQAKAGGDCTTQMEGFINASGQITKAQMQDIEVCRSYCAKVANYPSAREFCGLEECKVEAAKNGTPSPWCCNMAKIWGGKVGTRTNPLASLLDSCPKADQGEDVFQCVDQFRMNGVLSEKCCSQLPMISNYDHTISASAISYCSQRMAATACMADYNKTGKINHSCCIYAKANKGDILGSSMFVHEGNTGVAAGIQKGLGWCHEEDDSAELASCRNNFSQTKTYNKDCCKAFSSGQLIPNAEGMSYIGIDKVCNPENYQ